ncbi:interleukin-1 receptor type 2 [Arapaima gigas]
MTGTNQHNRVLTALVLTCFTSRAVPLSIPTTGKCLQVWELEEFHLQGEAVVLSCPMAQRVVLKYRLQHTSGYTHHFASDTMMPLALDSDGRVRNHSHHLWFLPAQTTDTGNYSCVFRNSTFCIAGTISLQVYERKGPHLDVISYFNTAFPGHMGMVVCPNLRDYNSTGNLQWFKETTPIELCANSTRYQQHGANVLVISDVSPQDEGFYTCELWVLFDHMRFKVTRTIKLSVWQNIPSINCSLCFLLVTASRHPEIVYPSHGDVFIGSTYTTLEIPCRVSVGDQPANSTEVIWLVNGLNIEESVLRGRAALGERVISRNEGVHIELRILIQKLREEDTRAEIKCVARNPGGQQEVTAQVRVEDPFVWLMVGCVGAVAFLAVVSVFLYLLLKPPRKKDYILTRQNSVF